jgi:putative endonuclease
MIRGGYAYIMTNRNNSVLYTGVTSELGNRIYQHKTREHINSFTSKYKTFKLVYYAGFDTIEEAIAEEKRIKGGSRAKKEKLINEMNPEWVDLYDTIPDGE